MQRRQPRHRPASMESAAGVSCGVLSSSLPAVNRMVERILVPLPTRVSMSNRSLFRRMFGRPMPAPNPISRAFSDAVDQPSRSARSTSGIPGPSSATSRSSFPLSRRAQSVPVRAWMTTFISASYAAIMARLIAAAPTPIRARCSFSRRVARPAVSKSPPAMR